MMSRPPRVAGTSACQEAGRVRVDAVPLPGGLAAVMVLPWAVASSATTARPMKGQRAASASPAPVLATADPYQGKEALMDTTDDRIAVAPLPTPRTLRRRRSIPLQVCRFGTINLRMLPMVRKAH